MPTREKRNVHLYQPEMWRGSRGKLERGTIDKENFWKERPHPSVYVPVAEEGFHVLRLRCGELDLARMHEKAPAETVRR